MKCTVATNWLCQLYLGWRSLLSLISGKCCVWGTSVTTVTKYQALHPKFATCLAANCQQPYHSWGTAVPSWISCSGCVAKDAWAMAILAYCVASSDFLCPTWWQWDGHLCQTHWATHLIFCLYFINIIYQIYINITATRMIARKSFICEYCELWVSAFIAGVPCWKVPTAMVA